MSVSHAVFCLAPEYHLSYTSHILHTSKSMFLWHFGVVILKFKNVFFILWEFLWKKSCDFRQSHFWLCPSVKWSLGDCANTHNNIAQHIVCHCVLIKFWASTSIAITNLRALRNHRLIYKNTLKRIQQPNPINPIMIPTRVKMSPIIYAAVQSFTDQIGLPQNIDITFSLYEICPVSKYSQHAFKLSKY
jgi:hypothetical protein